MVSRIASLLFLFQLLYLVSSSPDYIVCSGYVNTLNETQNVHFDLSKIRMSLYYDGIKKDTTSCNPDGSYMLSIDEHEKKTFTLVSEGPTAAAFDPPFKTIDPSKNISLCKTNIIFVFLGFTIKGQVKSKYSNTGPAGFPVQLYLADGTLLKSAITENAGHYKFDNVYPGDYIVRAAQTEAFSVDPNFSSYTCKVSWTSAESCDKSHIVVSGYYIKGIVEKPLAGLIVAIYSKSEATAQERPPGIQQYEKELPTVKGHHLFQAKTISSAVIVWLI